MFGKTQIGAKNLATLDPLTHKIYYNYLASSLALEKLEVLQEHDGKVMWLSIFRNTKPYKECFQHL